VIPKRAMQSNMAVALLLVLVAGLAGCEGNGPTEPSERALMTFQVGGEQFRVQLGEDQVDAALRAQQGGAARIPSGRIVVGTGENSGWSWHLEDVAFVEVAIELCDGRPADVERGGAQFGGGRYCPWNASTVSINENQSDQTDSDGHVHLNRG
jgi:hypothetical protein